jgi:hypothetical protein
MPDDPSQPSLQTKPYADSWCLSPARCHSKCPPGGWMGHSGADWDFSNVGGLTNGSFDLLNTRAAMHFLASDFKEFSRVVFACFAPSR